FKSFFIHFLFAAMSGLCHAAHVSLETTTEYDAERGGILWMVANFGDSLADNLTLSYLRDGEIQLTTEPVFADPLNPESGFDESRSGFLELSEKFVPKTPGRYVFPFLLRYTDTSGAKQSSYVWTRYALSDVPDPPIKAEMSSPTSPYRGGDIPKTGLLKTGDLRVDLVSLANEPLNAKIAFLLPEGVKLFSQPPSVFTIMPGWNEVSVTLTNVSAFKGGTVPLIAVISYDLPDGTHYDTEAYDTIKLPAVEDKFPKLLPRFFPLAAFALWVVFFICALFRKPANPPPRKYPLFTRFEKGLPDFIVLGITVYICHLIKFPLAFTDTLCVGGDSPAHHCLIDQMFKCGKIVSWAPGWWSGFPAFRFYFPLPYAAMKIMSYALGHNIAFKLGSVLGIVILPYCLYWAGRILRFARPQCAAMACLALPLVFDNTHNMWGVNAYSTFAGMIANSWSFSLMIPALASTVRDATESDVSIARGRVRTVTLLAAVVLSHFFTSMMAALALGLLWVYTLIFFKQRKNENNGNETTRRFPHFPLFPLLKNKNLVLPVIGLCVFALTAWWVVPLFIYRPWSVDFGGKWEIDFFRTLHPVVWPMLALACGGIIACFFSRTKLKTKNCKLTTDFWLIVHVALLAASLLAFFYGGRHSEVFVNCRFWPFIVYSILMICLTLWNYVTDRNVCATYASLAVVATVCFSFAWRVGDYDEHSPFLNDNHVPFWAEGNFNGLEDLREGHVVYEIAEALRGAEGRIAFDLAHGNEQIGSSRIFEALPHLVPGGHVIEGGIVNSALGALFTHVVQGEISDYPAGWPLIVRPRSFAPESGLRHLEFMNVRHLIVRSNRTREAVAADPGWEKVRDFGSPVKWTLFKCDEPPALVRVWKRQLPHFFTDAPQYDLLEWMYVPSAVSEPAVFVFGKEDARGDFKDWLAEKAELPAPTFGYLSEISDPIPSETAPDGTITFTTTRLNEPHIIAVSYFPDWRVKGADKIYMAGPGYMCVYPTENEVRLHR
ncbi:MAG: hypothetical protein FWG05_05170, partial [Kiritimatiellaeota bacterium]|nr:hypothetical protein [Kiritimatiellota bacterium]